jgi:hypothetical protein
MYRPIQEEVEQFVLASEMQVIFGGGDEKIKKNSVV